MKKWGVCFAGLVFIIALLSSTASPAKEPAYVSEKPLYAKLALNQDGSKVLSVVFDESRGTGKGYNVLYADVDFSGGLDKAKQVEATVYKCPTGVHFYFPPIELEVRYNGKAAGVSNACTLAFTYQKHSNTKTTSIGRILRSSSAATSTTEEFIVTADVKLQDGPTQRQYSFRQTIRPSQDSNSDAVSSFPRNPEAEIVTKPDEQIEGNWGIGLDLAAGKSQQQITGGGCGCEAAQARFQCKPPIKAHVEIKRPDGSVVHRGDAALDKFTFG